MTLKHANWLRERVLKVTFREAMERFHILSPCPGMVHVLRLRNNGFIVGPEELFSSWTLARIKFIPSLDQYGCSSIKWSYDAIISSGLLSFAQSRLDSLANEKLTLRGKGKEDILLACMQVSVSPTTTKNKKTNCLRNPDFFQHQWSLYTFIFSFCTSIISGIFDETFMVPILHPSFLKGLKPGDLAKWENDHGRKTVNESLREHAEKYIGQPIYDVIR